MKDLQQFIGAKIERAQATQSDPAVVLWLRMADGSQRDLAIYALNGQLLHVRIDGMYVPPEEL